MENENRLSGISPKNRFFFNAPPLRAILEAWLLGLVLLIVLSQLAGRVIASVLGNGWFVLAGGTGIWCVLRTRVPTGTWRRRTLWELGAGLMLSLSMLAGIIGLGSVLHLQDAWELAFVDRFPTVMLMLGIGPGFVMTRAGLRVWWYWNRLRRRRMLWSLTHAHLTVVVVIWWVFGIGLVVVGPLREILSYDWYTIELLPTLAADLLTTLFPVLMVALVVTSSLLIAVLPPSALLSFWVARKTTRRLERLTQATAAFRAGDYATRVQVQGEDEVAVLQNDFNAMAEDLERTLTALKTERDKVTHLLEARRQLVASVSHELRTPLAVLRSYLESIQRNWRDVPPATLPQDLTVMEQELNRLQRLIDDLFTLSRVEAGGLALTLAPTDVAVVIQRCVTALAPLAWERERVELLADTPAALPLAQADAGRLEQVLTNLLRNALRHTPPGGLVIARAGLEEPSETGRLRLEVCDTGEGVAPEDLPYIWERFYRGVNMHQDDRGAGLGLALVKELTEAMGGTVAVHSVVGEGSCFTVMLPQAEG